MSAREIGLVGAGLAIVGVFTPVVSLPFIGNINLFLNGKGDGWFILVPAAIFAIAVLRNAVKTAWVFASISGLAVVFDFINMAAALSNMSNQMSRELAGNPFAPLGDALTASVSMQWGWAVLIIGTALMLYACRMLGKEQRLAAVRARNASDMKTTPEA